MTIDERLSAIRDAIQVDPGRRGLARLFAALPDDFAAACRSIAEHPSPRVAIVTGFVIPGVNLSETDGPPGSLFLAETLALLDIRCTIFADASAASAIWPVVAFTSPPDATHLIALERSGPSRADGRNRTMRGLDITDLTSPTHTWFEGDRDYVTIGIGDGGNEIGMGKLPHDLIADSVPNGAMIACRTPTDFLIVGGTSNWGAYALAAGVALLRGRPTAFNLNRERQLLEGIVDDGPLVDGVSGQRTATVDGLSDEDYWSPLRAIFEMQNEPEA